MKSDSPELPIQTDDTGEDRTTRIVDASLEVFSEYSFESATTLEIARRARVSKRDLYALFPDKQSLLLAAMTKILKSEDEKMTATIRRTHRLPTLRPKLEAVGMALIAEVVSVPMSMITRHVTLESINRPILGTVYYENGAARRSRAISELLSKHVAKSNGEPVDTMRAGKEFVALVSHEPYLTTITGTQDEWDADSSQSHVMVAVDSFLRANPWFG